MITEKYKIPYYSVDSKLNLSISSIFNYIMEIGSVHSDNVGMTNERLVELGYTWMLYQLRININKFPKAQEEISVNTWISKSDKLKSQREVNIVDKNGGILVEGTLVWLVIDIAKMRAVKIPEVIKEAYKVEGNESKEEFLNLSKLIIEEEGNDITVYKSDIDYNQHVNAGVYLRWIVDSIKLDNDKLQSIEILYKDQTFIEDKVNIKCQKTEDGYLHQILGNEKTKALAKTKWKE